MSNPRHVILLRTHRLNERLKELMLRYATVADHDVFVLYDNDRRDFEPFGVPELLTHSDEYAKMDLLYLKDNRHFGIWKNGDYAAYLAAHKLQKKYDFYWLVEYDAYINYSDLNEFFGLFVHSDADFIAPYLMRQSADWMWSDGLDWIFDEIYGCLFSMVRFSAAALDYCRMARLFCHYKFKQLALRGTNWPHCEAFVPSLLAQSSFSMRNINTFGAQLCTHDTCNAGKEKMRTVEEIVAYGTDAKIYHPIDV